MKLRIATRGSDLAQWQARSIQAQLEARGHDAEIQVYETRGDQETDTPLSELGSVGLFTAEIDRALLLREADVAVHSLKDLPLVLHEELSLRAIPERAPSGDVLISRGVSFAELPPGARVGTSSPRRAGWLRHRRPDLEIVTIRGNVPTRLQKVEDGEFDATILAEAGLERLGLRERGGEKLPMLPAPGQGALAIVTRLDEEDAARAVIGLDHRPTRDVVSAERAVLSGLGGGCSLPLGVHATRDAEGWRIEAELFGPDGERAHAVEANRDWIAATARVATRLAESGFARKLT